MGILSSRCTAFCLALFLTVLLVGAITCNRNDSSDQGDSQVAEEALAELVRCLDWSDQSSTALGEYLLRSYAISEGTESTGRRCFTTYADTRGGHSLSLFLATESRQPLSAARNACLSIVDAVGGNHENCEVNLEPAPWLRVPGELLRDFVADEVPLSPRIGGTDEQATVMLGFDARDILWLQTQNGSDWTVSQPGVGVRTPVWNRNAWSVQYVPSLDQYQVVRFEAGEWQPGTALPRGWQPDLPYGMFDASPEIGFIRIEQQRDNNAKGLLRVHLVDGFVSEPISVPERYEVHGWPDGTLTVIGQQPIAESAHLVSTRIDFVDEPQRTEFELPTMISHSSEFLSCHSPSGLIWVWTGEALAVSEDRGLSWHTLASPISDGGLVCDQSNVVLFKRVEEDTASWLQVAMCDANACSNPRFFSLPLNLRDFYLAPTPDGLVFTVLTFDGLLATARVDLAADLALEVSLYDADRPDGTVPILNLSERWLYLHTLEGS